MAGNTWRWSSFFLSCLCLHEENSVIKDSVIMTLALSTFLPLLDRALWYQVQRQGKQNVTSSILRDIEECVSGSEPTGIGF